MESLKLKMSDSNSSLKSINFGIGIFIVVKKKEIFSLIKNGGQVGQEYSESIHKRLGPCSSPASGKYNITEPYTNLHPPTRTHINT